MFPLIKPKYLKPGDAIAVISPSWAGPAKLPDFYKIGRSTLENDLGLEVIEMPNALADADWLAEHPEARAEDLHAAFEDPKIRAVIASIGGEDTIGILPHIDARIIAKNPKIFLGFSAATSIHFACLKSGVGSFYGPNILPNLVARANPFDYAVKMIRKTLFNSAPLGRVEANRENWTAQLFEFLGSNKSTDLLFPATGARILQGQGLAKGRLIGGCAEVLEDLKNTQWWPPLDTWRGAIMFYETYAATPEEITSWLRNFGELGILQILNGMIVGRPGGTTPDQHKHYDAALVKVLREFGLSDLPVLANLDFGHTDPTFTLPYGVMAEINCDSASLSITESAVAS